ncbi:MAG: GNAT family N-acetyltransferase [Anaerolineales bacterium]|nr:GNAT family N-acetyltransferase [Anaerolineales bacterium]
MPTYQIRPEDPATPAAIALLQGLSDNLTAITGSSGRASFDPEDVRGPKSLFVLAWDERDQAVGCGSFRPLQPGIAELKRMYALPGTRGVGTAVLQYLEAEAAQMGYAELWLETRRVNLRAVGFYRSRGYKEIPNFGKYVGRPEAICLAKHL